MTPDEVQMIFFGPFAYGFYLLAILAAMVIYYQWKWDKARKNNVLMLIKKADGHGDFILAPQDGGSISIQNPNSNTIRMWPINELATIDVPYPGVGFVPGFMQKNIRLCIVDEFDWEPMLNRGSYMDNIASPDVIEVMKEMAEYIQDERVSHRLQRYIEGLSPAQTREMIASPAVLGNLIMEKLTATVMTINKEVLDSMSNVLKKMNNMVTPTVFYIGIGIVIIGLLVVGVLVVQTAATTEALGADVQAIKDALGVIGTSY